MSSDVDYLLSLEAVRERSKIVLAAAEAGKLNSFDYDASRMPAVVDFVTGVINRDFGPDRFSEIPPHGRWQHFDVGGVERVAAQIKAWEAAGVDKTETVRRLIDLFFVSVLLDAGAGDVWTFREPGADGKTYNRSEGIAVASLYMVASGALSSSGKAEVAVDAAGLVGLTDDVFVKHFQVSESNPIIGVSPRVKLLNNVGKSLQKLPEIVGATGRPGNMVDYILKSSAEGVLDYKLMWSTLQKILIPSWPEDRPKIDGHPIGDAWPLKVLADKAGPGAPKAATIQPFHKLTQWLGYSLTVPFVRILGLRAVNADLGTGLPEYRNGGLFVDLGVLTVKPEVVKANTSEGETQAKYAPTEDTVVEWRAMTVALLDALYLQLSSEFQKQGVELSMAQMLEAGTWKGGRELAAKYRPETKSSPLILLGDGTLF